jgi:chromodomain-containing protein
LAYRPQANGFVERVNKEVLRHLRSIIYDERVLEKWYEYLPMVERIINSSYHSSIGTAPIRMLYGDMITIDRGLLTCWNSEDLVDSTSSSAKDSTPSFIKNVNEYIQLLNKQLENICTVSKEHQSRVLLEKVVQKDYREFSPGDFVLVSYPSRPPSKLTPMWRGPMLILEKNNNTYLCQDLLTHTSLEFDVSRLVLWNEKALPFSERERLRIEAALRDREEYVVETIMDHKGSPSKRSTMKFRVRWLGYGESDDSWLPWSEVKDLAALDAYLQGHPELLPFLG